jgi:hypothetical protein
MANLASALEVLMPSAQKVLLVLLDDRWDLMDLLASESTAPLAANRSEPELRLAVITLDVNVWQFIPVSGVEEEW